VMMLCSNNMLLNSHRCELRNGGNYLFFLGCSLGALSLSRCMRFNNHRARRRPLPCGGYARPSHQGRHVQVQASPYPEGGQRNDHGQVRGDVPCAGPRRPVQEPPPLAGPFGLLRAEWAVMNWWRRIERPRHWCRRAVLSWRWPAPGALRVVNNFNVCGLKICQH